MIAASILKSRGVENVIDIAGGYGAIKNTGLKRTDFACPSKAMKV
jgi:hydroxyacylglutathione hydrolase